MFQSLRTHTHTSAAPFDQLERCRDRSLTVPGMVARACVQVLFLVGRTFRAKA